EERPKGSAAIASKLCAELYHLEIIKEDIEDLERNMTRFLVVSKEENEEEGDKCSVVFSTEHKAGTLFRVLEEFARENINLTRIESV
ncbi:MAG: bifunctional chorismate mutase/prephenate dehydratase, partial [Desulfobacterales bacterium]|nr:bifunctional chorismate mutase/prephenate dehydratase [Desulfobacterales bacterium]